MALSRESIADAFRDLQDKICNALEKIDGKSVFREDVWKRPEGGGGRTRTLSGGNVIEKGGVAFSEVFGPVSDTMRVQLKLEGANFFATGVSIVLHPENPHIPIIHMNVRYFELDSGMYWFGGGIDLTPHYIVPAHAAEFHMGLKTICDKYHPDFYTDFKNWADDYFFIPHRNETRGVGGIFYDHLDERSGVSKQSLFDFALELGHTFPILYNQQVQHGMKKSYASEDIRWRNLRRGRYAEFNLVHDRGTKFGLLSGGRTESILMSLPPDASWEYMVSIASDTEQSITQNLLKKGVDWLKMH